MIINSATLDALRVNLKKNFEDGLAAAPSVWPKVAMEIPSGTAANVYAWLGEFPQMREWIGERRIKDIKENAYTLPNKDFESTISVPANAIKDDTCGMYGTVSRSMGVSAQQHIDQSVFAALKGGFEALCYDGQYFFDTDHPVYPNHDGTGDAESISNIVNPAVTTGPGWYLIDNRLGILPLIYQNRESVKFEAITASNNENVFLNNKYLYGTSARRAFGYAFWQLVVASRDTLNAANFETACQRMMSFRADGKRPLGLVPSLLVVPPALQSAAESLLKKQNLAGGESNINYNRVELLVTPWLA